MVEDGAFHFLEKGFFIIFDVMWWPYLMEGLLSTGPIQYSFIGIWNRTRWNITYEKCQHFLNDLNQYIFRSKCHTITRSNHKWYIYSYFTYWLLCLCLFSSIFCNCLFCSLLFIWVLGETFNQGLLDIHTLLLNFSPLNAQQVFFMKFTQHWQI